MTKSLIYGPVASRRLGHSLGIDAVPYKICSFDCIYCQIGRTCETTLERRDFGLSGRILETLDRRLNAGVKADHITLGGSGEPTLNLELGAIIRGIKQMTDIPVAVLTNASLLGDSAVQEDLRAADVVLPSIDAADEETFVRINRPHPDISFKRVVEGVASFSGSFKGQIWLEIFFIRPINTSDAQIQKFRELVETLNPDRVHLNTAVRPPAESFVTAVDRDFLASAAARIGDNAEVIADFRKTPGHPAENDLLEDELMGMLSRRPCTMQDIMNGLGAGEMRVAKLLDRLISEGRVTTRTAGPQTYYQSLTAS